MFDLDADKRRPPVTLRDARHLRELPRLEVRRADVPDLPALHEVMQRLHRLLWRGERVPEVDLQDVDVRCAKPLEGRRDLVEKRDAREPALVHVLPGLDEVEGDRAPGEGCRVVRDDEAGFRHDDNLLSGDVILHTV